MLLGWSCVAAWTANAAKQKGQGLKPLLHHIYETRARSYKEAVQQFVEGYKEGYVGQPASKPDEKGMSDTNTKANKPDTKVDG